MTREDIVKIIDEEVYAYHGVSENHREAIDEYGNAADRILAALEKEREGEVVLAEINYGENFRGMRFADDEVDLFANGGCLIFRPTKAEKGGK